MFAIVCFFGGARDIMNAGQRRPTCSLQTLTRKTFPWIQAAFGSDVAQRCARHRRIASVCRLSFRVVENHAEGVAMTLSAFYYGAHERCAHSVSCC
jgi:hypothetical protein